MQQQLGFANFLHQVDTVGGCLLLILLTMSIATWYLIITKSLASMQMRRHAKKFLGKFWNAPSMDTVARELSESVSKDPFSRLAQQGFRAISQHHSRGQQRLIEAGSQEEYLTRALRRTMNQDTAKFESGLTLLASVGASAPFVGLFGTVWGVYHALVNIGMSGQSTLDKIAGPVGEALIMTALGLAVAIPAVLAYNFFTRANRVVLAELDSFAHDLFAFMSTGARVSESTTDSMISVLRKSA